MTQENDYEAAVRMFRTIQDANRALKTRDPKDISAVRKQIASFDQRIMNHASGEAFGRLAVCLDLLATVFEDSLTKPHVSLHKEHLVEAMAEAMPMVASVATLARSNVSLNSEEARVMTALGIGVPQVEQEQHQAA
jgi:hypothetical protein